MGLNLRELFTELLLLLLFFFFFNFNYKLQSATQLRFPLHHKYGY